METLKQLLRIAVVVLLFATTTSFVFWLKRSAGSIEQHHLPHITVASVDVTGISTERVNMLAHVWLDNKEAAGINIDSIDYTIYIEDEHVLTKTYKEYTNIKPAAQTSIALPVNLKYENLNIVFKNLHAAGKDSAQMKISMILYSKSIPAGSKKIYVLKNVPAVSLPNMYVKKMEISKRTDAGTLVNVIMIIRNPNNIPFRYNDVVCNVTFKQQHKSIDVSLQQGIKIPAKGWVRVVVPVNLSREDIGYLLTKGKDLQYAVKMTAKANSNTIKDNKLSVRAFGRTELVQEMGYEL